MTVAILQFAVLAAIILVAGTKLSYYADVIAEKSGLGRTWIGVILLASVTSVPELAAGISSVVVVNAPDLAVGDVLGSCMFNLLIIALMDFVTNGPSVAARADPGHTVAAGFSILLLSAVALPLLTGGDIPAAGWVGLSSVVLMIGYLLAINTIFEREKEKSATAAAVPLRYPAMKLAQAGFRYAALAVVIIGAASFLPAVGARLAVLSGLGETFVGSLFIAFSTSVPELVVSLAAVRIGAVDLALGNILGSNLFNMSILMIDDVFFTAGPILQHVSPTHGVSAIIAIAMTAVVIIAIAIRAQRRFIVTWESIVILVLYLLGGTLLFAMRVPVK